MLPDKRIEDAIFAGLDSETTSTRSVPFPGTPP